MRSWLEEKAILIGFVVIVLSALAFSTAPIIY